MKVHIKRLDPKSVMPSYSKDGDAGLDITVISVDTDKAGYTEYGTGLAIEIPFGYVGLIFPRSSISNKSQILCNAVAVIDSGFRGEIKLRMKNTFDSSAYFEDTTNEWYLLAQQSSQVYKKGEKAGQLIILPYPQIELIETEYLTDTARGDTGFGSTEEVFI